MADIQMVPDAPEYESMMERPEFRVADMASASWCVRKIREARLAMAEHADTAQKEYARLEKERAEVDDWLEYADRLEQNTIDRMEALLEPWVKERTHGQKKRSVSLPFGDAGYRKSPARLEPKDKEAMLAWCKMENITEAINTTESVLLTPLVELFRETGEVPDGCEPVPERDTFYVKVKEG